eukprot:3083430-Prymnesium_polylepis.1
MADFSSTPHTAPLWQQGGARAESAAAALRVYVENILERPSQMRFRRIREQSDGFQTRVAACPGALDVLMHCGFARQQYHVRRGQTLEHASDCR